MYYIISIRLICDLLSNSSRPPTAGRELTAQEKRNAREESVLPSVCEQPEHCEAQLLERPAHRMAFGNCLWPGTIFVPSSLWHKISTNFLRQCSRNSAYQLRQRVTEFCSRLPSACFFTKEAPRRLAFDSVEAISGCCASPRWCCWCLSYVLGTPAPVPALAHPLSNGPLWS